MDPDPCTQVQQVSEVEYAAPGTYDEFTVEEIYRITGIPWFLGQAVLADVSNEFV